MNTNLVDSSYGRSLVGQEFVSNIPMPVRRALVVDHRVKYDGDGEFSTVEIRAVRFGQKVSRDDLRAAADAIGASLRPGGAAANLSAMLKLRAVARQRATDSTDFKIATATYGEQIARYPTDAVAQACERWMRISPFWPALSELIAEIESALRTRQVVLRAIEAALKDPDVMPPAPETREERLTNAVRILRKHGREESAAKSEIELAKLQERDPEPWALAVQPKPVRKPTPLFGRHSLEMETKLNELAIAARKKLLEGGRS